MIHEIFPTSIWIAPVKNFDSVQEEISHAVSEAQWDYYNKDSEGWGKTHQFSNKEALDGDVIGQYGMETLQQEIFEALQQFDPSHSFDSNKPPQSWLTKYDVGDYAHIHNHAPAKISGAYSYDVGEENNFFFTDMNKHVIPPLSTGDLVLFHGSTFHGVRRVENGSRIVLSFNLF